MDLSAVDDVTLRLMHSEAVQAFGALQTGRREVSMSVNQGAGGRSVTYNQTTIADLRAWLAMLAAELAARGLLTVRPTRRAIGLRFG